MIKKNPLFVVTDEGQTVEQADHVFDAIIKKLGLQELGTFFKTIFDIIINLIEQTNSYAMLESISLLLNDIINILETIIKKIDPVLAFSIFKR